MAGERGHEDGVLEKLLCSLELPRVAAMDGERGSSGVRVK